MSQLIHLKQRIKAIVAIKKITQTMRLISMSSHSKLKKQSEAMQRLKDEINPLLCAINQQHKNYSNQLKKPKYKTLYILFASEKGLCGSFNTTMFSYFNKHLTEQTLQNSHVISVGKKTTQYLLQKKITPLITFDKILPNKVEFIAQKLYESILKIHYNYKDVICFYSYPKTFFIQEAYTTTIIPTQNICDNKQQINLDDYEWPQNIEDVSTSLFHTLLKVNILLILSNSMLSEHSARFLSMDNATRSADNLEKSMKLSFNKLRQAKITRELIELISGF